MVACLAPSRLAPPLQVWERRVDPKCSEADISAAGVACSQLVNTASGKCLTKVGGGCSRAAAQQHSPSNTRSAAW